MRYLIIGLLKIHSFISKTVSFLAIVDNNGIHPKHYLTQYSNFFTDNIEKGQRVLDVGCGNGYVADRIAAKAGTVEGIDFDVEKIASAKQRFKKDNLNFILGDATNYSYTHPYDAIVLSNVLEHIKDRHDFLMKIKHLAPKLLIRVPMLNRDWLVLYKKELGISYMCDPTHQTEYTMESFKSEMEKADLKIASLSIQFGEIWAVVTT